MSSLSMQPFSRTKITERSQCTRKLNYFFENSGILRVEEKIALGKTYSFGLWKHSDET